MILVWRIKNDSPDSNNFPAMMVTKILDEQLVTPLTEGCKYYVWNLPKPLGDRGPV